MFWTTIIMITPQRQWVADRCENKTWTWIYKILKILYTACILLFSVVGFPMRFYFLSFLVKKTMPMQNFRCRCLGHFFFWFFYLKKKKKKESYHKSWRKREKCDQIQVLKAMREGSQDIPFSFLFFAIFNTQPDTTDLYLS